MQPMFLVGLPGCFRKLNVNGSLWRGLRVIRRLIEKGKRHEKVLCAINSSC